MRARAVTFLPVCLLVGACVNGPVRYSALGSFRYAAVEYTRGAAPAVVPLAVAGGVATDAVVTAGDTLAFPVDAVAGLVYFGGAVVRGQTDPWTRWALPVLIPVYALVGGYGPVMHPGGVAGALGLREGPYGATPERDGATPERDDAVSGPRAPRVRIPPAGP